MTKFRYRVFAMNFLASCRSDIGSRSLSCRYAAW
jgi:hypothetical protein